MPTVVSTQHKMDIGHISKLHKNNTIHISGNEGNLTIAECHNLSKHGFPPMKIDLTIGLMWDSPFHIRRSLREWLDHHPNTWYCVTVATGCALIIGGIVVACTGLIPVGVVMISSGAGTFVHILPTYSQTLNITLYDNHVQDVFYKVLRLKSNKTVTIVSDHTGNIGEFQVDAPDGVTYRDPQGKEVETPGYTLTD